MSHQIRAQADRLLGQQVTDVDGDTQDRRGTVSVFIGPDPVVRVVDTSTEESAVVAAWLRERSAEGLGPAEIAIFVRSSVEAPRAQAAVQAAGLQASMLADDVKTPRDRVVVGTMHLGKGLEFRPWR